MRWLSLSSVVTSQLQIEGGILVMIRSVMDCILLFATD